MISVHNDPVNNIANRGIATIIVQWLDERINIANGTVEFQIQTQL